MCDPQQTSPRAVSEGSYMLFTTFICLSRRNMRGPEKSPRTPALFRGVGKVSLRFLPVTGPVLAHVLTLKALAIEVALALQQTHWQLTPPFAGGAS